MSSERTSRRTLFRAVAVLGAIVISFAVSECALRALDVHHYKDEKSRTVLQLRMRYAGTKISVVRSGIDASLPDVEFRTDERGYVFPSFQHESPDSTIVFLGGSTTECLAVDENERWPYLVSKMLEQRGARVNSLNAGNSGNSIHDALNILLNHAIHDRPSVAVLMEAVNDYGVLAVDPTYRSRSARPMDEGLVLSWMWQKLSRHSALVGLVRDIRYYQGHERLDRLPRERRKSDAMAPIEPFSQRLRAFIGICRAFDIVPVLMTQPSARTMNSLTPEWMEENEQARFNQAIRDVAREEGVLLIDLARYVESLDGWQEPMRVFYDGLHVTESGSRIYAEHVTDQLLRNFSEELAHRGNTELNQSVAP